MLVELVTTGSELLLGEISNVDVQYLSQQLNTMGYSVIYHTTVGDNPQRMKQVLETALGRADMVITTGGLGPTQGDMTKIITSSSRAGFDGKPAPPSHDPQGGGCLDQRGGDGTGNGFVQGRQGSHSLAGTAVGNEVGFRS